MLVCILVLCALATVGCTEYQDGGTTLPYDGVELTSIYSFTIAQTDLVSGISVDAAGATWLWNRSGGNLVKYSPDIEIPQQFLPEGTQPVEVFSASSGIVEVLDGASKRVLIWNPNGESMSFITIPTSDSIVSARRLGDRDWVVQVSKQHGDALYRFNGSTYRQIFETGTSGPAGPFVFDADSTGVIVVYRDPALSPVLVDLSSGKARRLTSGLQKFYTASFGSESKSHLGVTATSIGQSARDSNPVWAAINSAKVGSVSFISMADLRSGRKLIVTLDSTGSILRETELPLTLTLLRFASSGGFVVALRESNNFEIVVYKWRWRSADHNK